MFDSCEDTEDEGRVASQWHGGRGECGTFDAVMGGH